MPFKHWQALGIDHLFRKPLPEFDDPFSKEIFPKVKSDAPI